MLESLLLTRRQFILCAVIFLAACAAAVQGAVGLWLDVPYIRQEKDGCGSASLAMVLRYWQTKNVSVAEKRTDPGDLRSHIAKGRPLIAGLKPKRAPAHYVVIVGVDPQDAAVLVNDPERGKLLRMDRSEFEKVWHGTDNWTLLAVPNHDE